MKNHSELRMEDLYKEFEREIIANKRWEWAGLIIGYGAYLLSFLFVFGFKWEAPRMANMFYFGLFTRISSLLINRYYLVPKIFLRLLSSNEEERELAWNSIQIHREAVYRRLSKNLYGWNDATELYEADRDSLVALLQENTKKNWRAVGFWYIWFYAIVGATLVFFTFYPGEEW
ncbi:hypothetical protein [Leptospira perolatii]|nr:hypothetical protein [Leptospira perolatii]